MNRESRKKENGVNQRLPALELILKDVKATENVAKKTVSYYNYYHTDACKRDWLDIFSYIKK